MNTQPETYRMYVNGMYLLRRLPATTPKKEERTRAKADPINVHHTDEDLEARSIVDSCVLSPSSARKTTTNAIPIDLSIN